MPDVHEEHLEVECRAAAAALGGSFSIARAKQEWAPDRGWVVSIEDPDGEQGFFGTGDTPQDAMVDLLGKLPTPLESA
jgi:hypothetical protein